jgi:hypothetical protein
MFYDRKRAEEAASATRREPTPVREGGSVAVRGIADVASINQDHLACALHKVLKTTVISGGS